MLGQSAVITLALSLVCTQPHVLYARGHVRPMPSTVFIVPVPAQVSTYKRPPVEYPLRSNSYQCLLRFMLTVVGEPLQAGGRRFHDE